MVDENVPWGHIRAHWRRRGAPTQLTRRQQRLAAEIHHAEVIVGRGGRSTIEKKAVATGNPRHWGVRSTYAAAFAVFAYHLGGVATAGGATGPATA